MSLTPNPPLNPKITRFCIPANSEALAGRMLAIKGLDGLQDEDQESASFGDPAVMEDYRRFESSRGYTYEEVRKGPDRDTKP